MRTKSAILLSVLVLAGTAMAQAVVDGGTSGIPNDATVMGNGSIVGGGGPFGTDAYNSPAGTFDDRLQIARDANLTELDIPAGGSYTMTAFYQFQGGGTDQGVALFGSCCAPREGYTLQVSGGTLRWWGGSSSDDANYNCYNNNINPNDGQWHLLAVRVQDGGTCELIIDGSAVGCPENVPTSPSLANANPGGSHAAHNPQIGGRGVSYSNTADSLISDVRIYSTLLTPAELSDIQNTGAGPDPDLLWLLGGAGAPPPPPPGAPVSGTASILFTIMALMGATLVILGRRSV